ncbi:MAG: ATP-binding protein [Candidatus Omnitrophica bacterium]|nr:ATP-binding protein [Candidatus Omnitrophota bacterium]
MDKKTQTELTQCLNKLLLPTVARNYTSLAEQARTESMSYEQFLLNIMRQEYDHQRAKRIERYLKESRLPLEKTLDVFDFKRLPAQAIQQVRTLSQGEFTTRKENLLIFGTPGAGKTHVACGIGHELIRQEKRVYFSTCALLLQELLSAKKGLKLVRLIKSLSKFDALIIDDIGYVQQDQKEMEVLFTLLAERYERGSVIITSNLSFSKWENIFKDPMMTAAAIDRIVHHSVIMELNIESFRINSAKNRKTEKEKQEKLPVKNR